MQVAIRKMALEDAEAVNGLTRQLGYVLSIPDTKGQMEQVLCKNDHIAYVAVLEGKVVGWIHAFLVISMESKSFLEIGGLVIDERLRGHKIGSALVETVKQWSATRHIVALRVRSNRKRTDAHRFYLTTGFREIKEQKVFALDLAAPLSS
jgi:GNAT superfamily N-acetyltransferase